MLRGIEHYFDINSIQILILSQKKNEMIFIRGKNY